MDFRACIFDLDGTLLNTLDDLADSVNLALAESGLCPHPVQAYKKFIGNGVDMLIYRAAGCRSDSQKKPADDDKLQDIKRGFLRIYAENQRRKTRPYDGIVPLLSQLKSRGLRLGVLSNKMHPNTVEVVSFFFPGLFDAVAGQRQGVPPKPHPAGAHALITELGVSADEVLYIGDSGVDMETAQNAGFVAVGALWGFRDEEELSGAGARYLISSPGELLALLDPADRG